MNRNILETLMGAVVLAVAAFFMIFVYTSSGLEKHNGTLYTASFDRVDGIVIGSDVRMSGVKIGIVTDINIDPKTYLAHMTFSVESHLRLPTDSSAEIVSSGLLGDKYLALIPGGDDENLKDGDAIHHTQSSVSLESMIGQLLFSHKDEKNEGKSDAAKTSQTPQPSSND